MNKREFLKVSGIFAAGALIAPTACVNSGSKPEDPWDPANEGKGGVFTLPELPYALDALEPYIAKETMEVHHGKHHAGYVKKLNAAVEGTPFAGLSLEEIMQKVGEDDTAVRNNGGGHYNHSLFWEIMAPGKQEPPSGALADAINASFGSYDGFKDEFFKAAKSVFGSGWAWLAVKDHKLIITATPNQDNPAMTHVAEETALPIMGIDVWEHAYYLQYQNLRGDYINAFTEIINWEKVAGRFASIA